MPVRNYYSPMRRDASLDDPRSRPAALGARPVPRGRVLPVATPSAAVPAVHLPADVGRFDSRLTLLSMIRYTVDSLRRYSSRPLDCELACARAQAQAAWCDRLRVHGVF